MNRTFLKLSARGIKTSLARFIAILSIVALGTGFLAGLLASTPDLKQTAQDYFNERNAYDIDIKGTLGLTDDDVSFVRNLDYIKYADGIKQQDMIMSTGDGESFTSRIYGVDFDHLNDKDAVNKIALSEGRWPEAEDECVIEVPNQYGYEHKIGETISISDENKDYRDLRGDFDHTEYKVVGIVKGPLFISMDSEITSVGTGSLGLGIYIRSSEFKQDVYTDIYAVATSSRDKDCFAGEYENLIESDVKKLKEEGKERSKLRESELKDDAEKELEEAREEYEDSKKEAETELASAKSKLDDALEEITAGEARIASAEKALKKQKKAFEKQKKMMSPEARKKAETQIAASESKLKKQKSKIEAARAEYESGLSEYYANREKVNEELKTAEEKLEEGEEEIDEIGEGKWYVTDRSDTVSFTRYDSDISKVAAVAKVFPIFFFIVAILVALTTMTRMIDEERVQIGTLKSLGYARGDILKYYLGYGGLASLAGCVLGMGVGMKLFPIFIDNAYKMMYNLPDVEAEYLWYIMLPIALMTIAGIMAVSYIACRSALRETPASLLLPRAPEPGKRIWLERIGTLWRRLKFSQKVTLRNLFRYKKRFLMTIIGVAGCFALLVTAFGLRDSIGDVISKQYEMIYKFDFQIAAKDEQSIEDDDILSGALNDGEYFSSYMQYDTEQVTLLSGDNKKRSDAFIPENDSELKDFLVLKNRKSGEDIPFGEKSAVLTEKTAENLGLDVGDEFTLRTEAGDETTLTLTGITECYVSNTLYIDRALYEEAAGESLEFSNIYAKRNHDGGYSDEETTKRLLESENVSYVMDNAELEEQFSDSIKSLNYVILMVIVSAGLLALIVLYNLTNVNICERRRELATIKVLGFFEREVQKYVFRETNILSAIGMALGVPLGIWLHAFIIKTIEVDDVMFGRNIYWQTFLYSVIMTTIFTLLVNLVLRRSIKKIDMTASMKAND